MMVDIQMWLCAVKGQGFILSLDEFEDGTSHNVKTFQTKSLDASFHALLLPASLHDPGVVL
jgi:hypothetical protein